ncbi:GGDEF domain-containing response regulator [Pyxidicoccus xibeiensis]|uniref:GGDEF domain-containing response regulator n=1 Tax=Pyxidicoccus xibeiensis TaxID=2906759 RepID=UPI0020A703A3|nr:diguanylate cyclase [Pyxidicoccus xibeiensis]MCP3140416.1 diguanylate cyclase [Pyxidicoccus xibeiensis]
MTTRPYTLLLVDDSQSTLPRLARALGPEDFALRLTGYGPEVPRLAREVALVVLCPGQDPAGMLALLERLMPNDGTVGPPVVVLAPAEPRNTWLEALRLGAEVIIDPWEGDELVGRVRRSLAQHHRLQSLSTQVGELQRLSATDGLTGVHNHRHFQERLREEFRRAQRYDDALSLILLDLDHFKDVNDRYGHAAGDGVLREVAGALQRGVRETDLVARYGGEEFAVLLPRTHLTGALTVAERVRRELRALRLGGDGTLHVTASLGVSSFPHRTVLSPEQLLLTADEALYQAKHEGRDRICLHPQMPPFPPPSSQGS